MKEYRIQKVYDDDQFIDVFQITQIRDSRVILTVRSKEGNLLDTLKSKLKKEFLVYSGYLKQEIGVLRSNIGLSSVWKMILKGKEVAKAEIKGVQYFTIKIKDGKQDFSGKTTDLNDIELTRGRDFSSCVTSSGEIEDNKLDLLVKLECKVSPEALMTFGVALDNKFLFDSEN